MPHPIIDAIQARTSARQLGPPAPTQSEIDEIIRAGMCAPDHGRLRPWRFIVLQGEGRDRLGGAMAESVRTKMPDASEERLQAVRGKAQRAPTIVVVAARIVAGKIPEIEQLLAVGAATQNMCLAAEALGLGAMWKSGAPAYDASVKRAIGLEADDHIVAFLYLGTVLLPGQARDLGEWQDKVHWMANP